MPSMPWPGPAAAGVKYTFLTCSCSIILINISRERIFTVNRNTFSPNPLYGHSLCPETFMNDSLSVIDFNICKDSSNVRFLNFFFLAKVKQYCPKWVVNGEPKQERMNWTCVWK